MCSSGGDTKVDGLLLANSETFCYLGTHLARYSLQPAVSCLAETQACVLGILKYSNGEYSNQGMQMCIYSVCANSMPFFTCLIVSGLSRTGDLVGPNATFILSSQLLFFVLYISTRIGLPDQARRWITLDLWQILPILFYYYYFFIFVHLRSHGLSYPFSTRQFQGWFRVSD